MTNVIAGQNTPVCNIVAHFFPYNGWSNMFAYWAANRTAAKAEYFLEMSTLAGMGGDTVEVCLHTSWGPLTSADQQTITDILTILKSLNLRAYLRLEPSSVSNTTTDLTNVANYLSTLNSIIVSTGCAVVALCCKNEPNNNTTAATVQSPSTSELPSTTYGSTPGGSPNTLNLVNTYGWADIVMSALRCSSGSDTTNTTVQGKTGGIIHAGSSDISIGNWSNVGPASNGSANQGGPVLMAWNVSQEDIQTPPWTSGSVTVTSGDDGTLRVMELTSSLYQGGSISVLGGTLTVDAQVLLGLLYPPDFWEAHIYCRQQQPNWYDLVVRLITIFANAPKYYTGSGTSTVVSCAAPVWIGEFGQSTDSNGPLTTTPSMPLVSGISMPTSWVIPDIYTAGNPIIATFPGQGHQAQNTQIPSADEVIEAAQYYYYCMVYYAWYKIGGAGVPNPWQMFDMSVNALLGSDGPLFSATKNAQSWQEYKYGFLRVNGTRKRIAALLSLIWKNGISATPTYLNGDFEDAVHDQNGGLYPANWHSDDNQWSTSPSGGITSINASTPHAGKYCLQIASVPAGKTTRMYMEPFSSFVVGNDAHSASCYVNVAGAGSGDTIQMQVIYYSGLRQTQQTNTISASLTSGSTGGWVQLNYSGTAPSTARYARIYVVYNASTGGGTALFDDVTWS